MPSAQVVRPLDPASPGWTGMLGFGFFVEAMTLSTALRLAPMWLAALLMGFTLFGWAAWKRRHRHPRARDLRASTPR